MTTDPIIKLMQDSGIPVTRKEYLYIAYMGNPAAELSAEEKAELPEELQLKGH
jgi:hypothetical protein